MSQLWASVYHLRVGSVRKGENMKEVYEAYKILVLAMEKGDPEEALIAIQEAVGYLGQALA